MTTENKVARRRLSGSQPAANPTKVSRACQVMCYSRLQFDEIRAGKAHGAQGLLDRFRGTEGTHPHRMSEDVEMMMLAHDLNHPCRRCLRVAPERSLKGIQVSAGGLQRAGSRHMRSIKHGCLVRLKGDGRTDEDRPGRRAGSPVGALQPRVPRTHIDTRHTVDLVAVDSFFVGVLRGAGRCT